MNALLEDEDTVEGRILAYFDFIFVTAQNYLRGYQHVYGLDLRADAQDIAQEVARKTLAGDAYGPSLGTEYFKTVTINLCINLLRSKKNELAKTERAGSQMVFIEKTERAGWIDLAKMVSELPEKQRMAVAEKYFGYPSGELSGSPSGSKMALGRARKTLKARIQNNN